MARAKKRSSKEPRGPRVDTSVDLLRLIEIAAAFPRQTVCVLGDPVVDEFVSGEISRVSREAPVLILRHRCTDFLPGGAANAANNLADLGARVLLVGAVGDDEAGRKLLEFLRAKGVNVSGVARVRGGSTTVKTRYFAGWTHTTEQQVLRVDREPAGALADSARDRVRRSARRSAREANATLVSDYGLGVVEPDLLRVLGSKPILLDSRYRLLDYRDAGVTAATPNEAELEAAYHTKIGSDSAKLGELGTRARSELGLEALLVTRGKSGMSLFEAGPPRRAGDSENAAPPRHISIYGSDAPVDVTGAGDTVIAVFTLAIAAGANYFEAAHLANYAAGVVVMKPRTATVSRQELETALRREATAQR